MIDEVNDMTEEEHRVAWAIWRKLRANEERLCVASCGCSKDPIVLIVLAMREARERT